MPQDGPTQVRWKMLGLLFVISFVAYVVRLNISVAAKFMMPDLGLTEVQMGWVFSAFVWGYAIFQFPGGVLGNRIGPRRTLTALAVLWAVVTVLTGFVPGLAVSSTFGIIAALLVIRFAMGAIQAPLFPVTALAIERWFPVGRWAFPNALLSTGLGLGAAFTPPLVAWLMLRLGWRQSFYVTAPVALLVVVAWWRYARDDPQDHPAVGDAELALIGAERPGAVAGTRGDDVAGGVERVTAPDNPHEESPEPAWRRLLRNRETLLLTFSYGCMNYVFYIFFSWFFIYLVDVRGFEILSGGFFASLPFVVGAIMASVGGETCDRLCARLGPRWGCRLPAMVGMVLVAGFLFAGATAEDAYWAVAFLSICFAFTQFTEGAYWSGATFVARRHTAAATGILNTGGNLGGVVSTPLIPILVEQVGWLGALSTGSVFALLGAATWLWIRVDVPFDRPEPVGE